jgi:hypothetical protein
MKRIVVLFAGILPLLAGAFSSASPMTGKRALGYVELEGGSAAKQNEKFRGGERACVIARGQSDVGLAVYDDKDRLVVKDEGPGRYVAVIWYPPRDAVYKIMVHNLAEETNKIWLSLK